MSNTEWNTRAAPVVKDLVWVEDDDHAMGYRENAESVVGTYWIEDHENSGEWRVYFDSHLRDEFIGGADSMDDAKAAAQADYTTRILSALA